MQHGYSVNLKREDISKLLREERAVSKLSIEDVVSRLKGSGIDISSKTLYGYENNVGTPKVNTFLALCEIYGITDIMSSLGFITPKDSLMSDSVVALTAEAERIARLYDVADERAKEIVEVTLKPFSQKLVEEAGAEAAAEITPEMEEYRADWNKGLTEEEAVAIVRKRYADAKRGTASSTTSGKAGNE